MKIKHLLIGFLGALLALNTFAADKLAIAEPVGKGGVKTLKTDHFTLTLSHGKSWDVKVNSKTSLTVYNKALNKADLGGKLVTILAYDAGDESYDVIPEYNVIGESNGKVYIAAYPTDVQFDESDKKSYGYYQAVFEEVSRLKAGAEGCPLVFNN